MSISVSEYRSLDDDNLQQPKKFDFLNKIRKLWYKTSSSQKIAFVVILLTLLAVIIVPIAVYSNRLNHKRNIIFMIGDGFGPASVTMARGCKGDLLNFDRPGVLKGTARTYSSDSPVTDSAAGATAYSCGLKTYNGAIGVDPNKVPCGTLLEAAKAKGMKTGMVVTSTISHATPGSFSAHSVHRDYEQFIAKQQVDNKVDLMFGGGISIYEKRTDGLNLTTYAIDNGYNVIKTPQQLDSSLKTPLIGLFADSHLDFVIDRNPNQPSLPQMVQTALTMLERESKENGFFLLIEGSRIDMAGHENDPAAQVRETLAFDAAIGLVMEFVDKDKKTIVVSSSDHETGGLTLGRNNINGTAGVYNWEASVLNRVNGSCGTIASWLQLNLTNIDYVRDVFLSYTGVNITEAEYEEIITGDTSYTVCDIISQHAYIGWTTYGHTGVDVNIYTYGFDSSDFLGNYNNIDLGNAVASLFKLDLKAVTEKLSNFNPTPPANQTTREAPHF